MAVLVLGGYGLIGQAVVQRLRDEGFRVIGSGRSVAAARRRWPGAEWREADIARLTTPLAWTPLLEGVDVVVNAAGLLQQGLKDDATGLQRHALPALYAAGAAAGLRRIVQISAAGVSHDASTAFMRDKAAADAALLSCGVEAVVLRPGLVIARTAYGGTAMLRGLAAFPGFTPMVLGERPIQTICIDDVAEAVAAAVAGRIPNGAVLDLVEPEARTLAATVGLFRQWLGLPPAPVMSLPTYFARPISAIADGLGLLGWRSPLRSTALAVIRHGVTGDPHGAAAALGRPARTLTATLSALPSSVQERWFSRMWLLKPIVLSGLSAFWLASGVIGLLSFDAASAMLTTRQAPNDLAHVAVLAGSAMDLALGLGVLARPLSRLALKGMILVSLGYLAGASLLAGDLWLDPIGPLVKIFPALILALVGLAVLDER